MIGEAVPVLETTALGAAEMHAHREDLLDVYRDAYADKIGSPFFTEDRHWERLLAYGQREGFALTMGHLDGVGLVGYALGYPLPEGSRWWGGLLTDVAPELVAEDGHRTFALTYIMVRHAWRRHGFARSLHDRLMQTRPEERATLLVQPQNVAAVTAYRSWGWYKIGDLKPFADAPTYDAMLLDLKQ
ncbi:hypothetical protein CS0771_25890 [Catellatospora sp. IY07-71]|nr:hypothetical protein CS0771_25890 [Catellatospora sp. IY07-71]